MLSKAVPLFEKLIKSKWGLIVRTLFYLLLLLFGSLLLGITIDDSIIGNILLKVLGALCFVPFLKTWPKENRLK
ncbi:hypothetical protein CHH80_06605 [Bacillus sp. 7504-2]|nr:hypothetical protein CHH80_06605 [Bacillus sp. 7504-2]